MTKLRLSSIYKKSGGRLPFTRKWRSSSICQKNEAVFHFKLSKPYLTALVYISSHFETIPGGWVAGGGGGRELDIRLAQSS